MADQLPELETAGHYIRTKRGASGNGGIAVAEMWLGHERGERERLARLFAASPKLLAFATECARADSDCGCGIRDAAAALIAGVIREK